MGRAPWLALCCEKCKKDGPKRSRLVTAKTGGGGAWYRAHVGQKREDSVRHGYGYATRL